MVKSMMFLVLLLFTVQCHQDTGVLTPPDNTGLWQKNFIANGSFEENGLATIKGWTCDPEIPYRLERDAPPGGGSWSLVLPQHGLFFQFRAFRFPVKVMPGMHIFNLSFWSKYNRKPGYAGLLLWRNKNIVYERTKPATGSHWLRQSLTDTVKVLYGDSLFVVLDGGGAEAQTLDTFTRFDLVELYEFYLSIIGSWRWIRSVGGFAGQILTPDSVGYSLQYDFQEDSTLTIYKNGQPETQSSFSVKTETVWAGVSVQTLYMENEPIRRVISFSAPDTLVLIDDCMDCYISTYIKMK